MTRLGLPAALALLFAAGPAAAAPDALGYAPPAAPAPPDPVGLITRLVLVTAAAAGVCLGVIWWARRAGGAPAADPAGLIAAEGCLPLDRRCAVHLLRVDGCAVAVTTDGTGLRSIVVLSAFDTLL